MKIIEGGLPDEPAWRALVLLSVGEELGLTWQLGLALARANRGEVVAVTVLPVAQGEVLLKARETLNQIRQLSAPEDPTYTAIIEAPDIRKALRQLVVQANIDLLLARSDAPSWQSLNHLPCAVAVVRGEAYNRLKVSADDDQGVTELLPLQRILVPTSGGPNSVHALRFLLPLTDEGVEVVAVYIAPERLGPNEEALGRSRLRQSLRFIDGQEQITSRLVTSTSVTAGIIEQAAQDFDLVIIGASRESTIDQALFGNIPDVLVRSSQQPVIVVREPDTAVGNLLREVDWRLQKVVPRLSQEERAQAYVRIRRSARPSVDFFVLIGLATAIAAFGLLINSPAVVIGAMLVAPLMSPIAGMGLAIVLGDSRFLRLTLGAVARGMALSVIVGLAVGLLNINQPMTPEVLARTQPTLLDLAVALFSGMAVAYALGRSDAAAALPGVAIAAALVPPLASAGIALTGGHIRPGIGALLLFLTNMVAISAAASLVFLLLGFRPQPGQKQRRATQLRSARLEAVLLLAVTAVLAFTTYQLAHESRTRNHIRELAREGALGITGGELARIEIGNLNDPILQLDIGIESTQTVSHAAAVELQAFLATELQREVAMQLTIIPTTRLDPFIPPTQTPEPTVAALANPPGPTVAPTATASPAPTNTPSPTITPTAEATAFVTETPAPTWSPTPAWTPTATAAPRTALVTYAYGLNLRAEPSADSELLGQLSQGQDVVLLEGLVSDERGAWQQVQVDGQSGWVLADYLEDEGP
jgi:uncharacterized hydrophobic protein (TIGR00271 family)